MLSRPCVEEAEEVKLKRCSRPCVAEAGEVKQPCSADHAYRKLKR